MPRDSKRALQPQFGTASLKKISLVDTCPMECLLKKSTNHIYSQPDNLVMNTVVPGFFDDMFRLELEKRRFQNQDGDSGIRVQESLLPLLQSQLFNIGPGRFTAMIRRNRTNN